MRHQTTDLRGQDIIDSRDVIARISYLEDEIASQTENTDAYPDGPDEDLTDEYKALKALEEEAEGCADWMHGEGLIRDSHFEDYARDLAEEIGAINRDATWPNTCIDWDEAASQLQQDYTSVEFDGVTYWICS